MTGHGAIGAWGGHGGTIIAGPSSAGAVVAGPGLGLGWGHGLWGHGLWGHGVRVQGPAVVPATISGPSGNIIFGMKQILWLMSTFMLRYYSRTWYLGPSWSHLVSLNCEEIQKNIMSKLFTNTWIRLLKISYSQC